MALPLRAWRVKDGRYLPNYRRAVELIAAGQQRGLTFRFIWVPGRIGGTKALGASA